MFSGRRRSFDTIWRPKANAATRCLVLQRSTPAPSRTDPLRFKEVCLIKVEAKHHRPVDAQAQLLNVC